MLLLEDGIGLDLLLLGQLFVHFGEMNCSQVIQVLRLLCSVHRLLRQFLRVGLGEELSGGLAELPDVDFVGHLEMGVFDLGEVDIAFVGVGVEDIVVLDGVLFAAEYEVDPEMEVVGYEWTFQSLPIGAQKVFW
jgi:hypothetical protein